MDQPGHTGLVLPDDCSSRGGARSINHKDRMNVIGHDHKFVYSASGKMLWDLFHTGLRNDAHFIQPAFFLEQALLFVGTDCDKVIIHAAVVVSGNPCWFLLWQCIFHYNTFRTHFRLTAKHFCCAKVPGGS